MPLTRFNFRSTLAFLTPYTHALCLYISPESLDPSSIIWMLPFYVLNTVGSFFIHACLLLPLLELPHTGTGCSWVQKKSASSPGTPLSLGLHAHGILPSRSLNRLYSAVLVNCLTFEILLTSHSWTLEAMPFMFWSSSFKTNINVLTKIQEKIILALFSAKEEKRLKWFYTCFLTSHTEFSLQNNKLVSLRVCWLPNTSKLVRFHVAITGKL